MNFASSTYLFFIVAVFLVYWHIKHRYQNVFILAASYFFYACWDWRFLSLILISTGVNFLCGFKIHAAHAPSKRIAWLVCSVAVNIGMIAYFKYAGFFLNSLVTLINAAGFNFHVVTLNIILPVGISFYTFQSLSYTLDIYNRKLEPTHSLIDFAAFVAFFPQLVAGPIVRAREFLYQLEAKRKFSGSDLQEGGIRFLNGFFKKVFIADTLAVALVDPVFANPDQFAAGTLWLAMFGYAVQIYADFSGYSSMAIGSAKILGFKIPENFLFPYLATNFSDFWKRWHITMSRFFRDYVFIPLGGSRTHQSRVVFNLAVTTMLSGLWHGAAWTFVIWGGLHGIFIVLSQFITAIMPEKEPGRGSIFRFTRPLIGWGLTQLSVCIAWIFFRSADFQVAWNYFSGLLGRGGNEALLIPPIVWCCFGAFFIDHLYGGLKEKRVLIEEKIPLNVRALACSIAIVFLFHAIPENPNPFIYFQF